MRRQGDHAQLAVLRRTNLGEQREAVLAGHLNVHEHQVGQLRGEGREQFLAAHQADDLVALQGEQGAEELHVVGTVFDNQDHREVTPSWCA